jgi:L-alanine-DL-glutamate epimerase-like enolase superfamily enzyme
MAISKGRAYTGYPGRVLKMETDEGLVGWGEGTPHGHQYLNTFAGVIQPGMEILAPAVLGMDPTNVEEVYHAMDEALLGQPQIKELVDIACWDIFGKHAGKPLYEMWGGKQIAEVPAMAFLPRDFQKHEAYLLDLLATFRSQGYTHFSSKAAYGPEYAIRYLDFMNQHLEPYETMAFDVNRGWTLDQAMKVCIWAKKLDISFELEQPCETYEECRDLMKLTGIPVLLDECVLTMQDLARAAVEGGIGGLAIKTGRVGGATPSKQMRDFCVSMRIPMTIMSSSGAEIADALLAHLGHSTPSNFMRCIWMGHTLCVNSIADGLTIAGHSLIASDQPGLGITVKEENLTLLQTWE